MRFIACSFILFSAASYVDVALSQTSATTLAPAAQTTVEPVGTPTASEATATDVQTVNTTQAAATPVNTIETNAAMSLSRDSKKKISGSLAVGYSSNLYERSSSKAEADTSAELVLNYRLKESHVLRGYIAGSQGQTQGREANLKDGYLAWVNDKFYFQNKITNVGQHVRLIVPASRESRLRDERITGVTVAPLAVFNLTPVGLTGVMLAYQPALTKNFHKYETNRAFKSNNEYSASQLFRIAWSFTDQAYILSDFVYRNAWSYQGTRKDDATTYNFELGYTFLSGLNWGVGVSTEATVRNLQNGTGENISLFNSNTSSVYTDLTYMF